MSLLLVVALALGGGCATVLLGRVRTGLGIGVGLLAAIAVLAAAVRIDPEESIALGGTLVAASAAIRAIAISWSGATIMLGVVDALATGSGAVLGPSLLGLGVAVVALATPDALVSFALLAGAGTAAVVVPVVRPGRPPTADRAHPADAFRVVLGASLLAIVVVAWAAAPRGPLATVSGLPGGEAGGAIGLGLVGMASAVVLRSAAIPAHVWAARLAELVPATTVPALLGWGSAAFALVAFSWTEGTIGAVPLAIDLERGLVGLVAVACIVLGGLAAWVHEDIEHILVYSLVQDAGIVLLAFVSPTPGTTPLLADWAFSAAAVKSGLAAWVATTRGTFDVHRLSDLEGWARRSPLLAAALLVVIAGAVAVPGMAAFDARSRLVAAAIPGPAGIVVLVAALAPLAYLGRLLVTGLRAPSVAVRSADGTSLRWRGGRTDGWGGTRSKGAAVAVVLAIPAEIRGNRLALAALAAIGLAALGIAVAAFGVEPVAPLVRAAAGPRT
jgi:hypothetical protein